MVDEGLPLVLGFSFLSGAFHGGSSLIGRGHAIARHFIGEECGGMSGYVPWACQSMPDPARSAPAKPLIRASANSRRPLVIAVQMKFDCFG